MSKTYRKTQFRRMTRTHNKLTLTYITPNSLSHNEAIHDSVRWSKIWTRLRQCRLSQSPFCVLVILSVSRKRLLAAFAVRLATSSLAFATSSLKEVDLWQVYHQCELHKYLIVSLFQTLMTYQLIDVYLRCNFYLSLSLLIIWLL